MNHISTALGTGLFCLEQQTEKSSDEHMDMWLQNLSDNKSFCVKLILFILCCNNNVYSVLQIYTLTPAQLSILTHTPRRWPGPGCPAPPRPTPSSPSGTPSTSTTSASPSRSPSDTTWVLFISVLQFWHWWTSKFTIYGKGLAHFHVESA